MQKRPINDHNFDSLSPEFAYAGNTWKKYAAYAAYMPHICAAYFASKLSAYFKKILRYKPTSLTVAAVRVILTSMTFVVSFTVFLHFYLFIYQKQNYVMSVFFRHKMT